MDCAREPQPGLACWLRLGCIVWLLAPLACAEAPDRPRDGRVIEASAPDATSPDHTSTNDGRASDAGPDQGHDQQGHDQTGASDASSTCGCLAGEGPYCAARAKALAQAAGCTIPLLAGHAKDLLRCEGDQWSVLSTCGEGCTYTAASAKLDDSCKLPECPCFVKVAWCGSGAAKQAVTMGCRIPLLPAHDGDILYCPGGVWSVKQTCNNGCVEAPTGTPDSCKSISDYLAPFNCGSTRTCSNGNNTSSHSGTDAYAYDFAMPVGTTLRAMRAGKVLRVRMVSKPGSPCYHGGGSSCANYANTVEILHGDGTVGLYMHLSSTSVTKGQNLAQGAVVGKSGNSGWSTGPHLHCQVQKNCGIWWCQSVPFKFGEKASISAGTSLTSKNCP